MTSILLHNTWQMNLPWPMKPQYQSRDDLHTTTQNWAGEPILPEYNGKGLKARSHILHFWDTPQHFLKTHFCWEISFLFFLKLQKSLLVSWVIKNKCLEYCYSKLGRWTFFSQWTPSTTAKMTGIPLHKTWQMNLPWPMKPQYQSRYDLHTTTQNWADEPTLPEYNGKGLKAVAFTVSEILYCIFWKHVSA